MASRGGAGRAGSKPGYLSKLVDGATEAPRAGAPFRPAWGPAVGGAQAQELLPGAADRGAVGGTGRRAGSRNGSGARRADGRLDVASDSGSAQAGSGLIRDRSVGESGGLRAAANPVAGDRSGDSGSRVGSVADGSGSVLSGPARSVSDGLAANLGDRPMSGPADSHRPPGSDQDGVRVSAAGNRSAAAAAQGQADHGQATSGSGLRAPSERSQSVDRTVDDRGVGARTLNVDNSAIGVRPLLPERPPLTAARADAEPQVTAAPPAVQIGVVEVRIMPPAPVPITVPTSQPTMAGRGAPATAPARLSRPAAAYGLAQG